MWKRHMLRQEEPLRHGMSQVDINGVCYLVLGHYYELFNCVKSKLFTMGDIDSNEDVTVLPQERYDAIMMLKDNKACGMNEISEEH